MTSTEQACRPFRLRRSQIINLGRLLYMEYTPAELAREIGTTAQTLHRHILPLGCPHRRDEEGQVWIVGTEFSRWAMDNLRPRSEPMREGEAYCLGCRARVKMSGRLGVQVINRYLELLKGECPLCGRTVNRARARKKVG